MKARLLFVLMFILIGFSGFAQSLSGKEMFKENCSLCHTIGKGDVVGPDLAGVTARRDVDWIKSFILNSQKMVQEGNKQALELFNKYNKIPMPPHNFSNDELHKLLSYLEEASVAQEEKAAAPEITQENPEPRQETGTKISGGEIPMFVIVLFSILGVIALSLALVAAYLFRLLRS